ncbi:MAG: response regulator transcription factor [Lactobacillales bacterium]|jgi:two-component system response regulator CiaR|nr:response regulator transcription factor [Lactobacillales bacterium]
MIKVLLIEDDKKLSASIVEYLKDFALTPIFDGEEGVFEALNVVYDAIILDWMLPNKSGIEILERVRKQQVTTPILMLTAKDGIEDKMQGFDFGADDYLTKPFYLEELAMRLKILLKRSGRMLDEYSLVYKDLVINLKKQAVIFQDKMLDIQGKELELLIYLVQNQGTILPKEQIFDRIWGFESETVLSVVEVYMSKLRKKLKAIGIDKELQTIRNVGYLLKKYKVDK